MNAATLLRGIALVGTLFAGGAGVLCGPVEAQGARDPEGARQGTPAIAPTWHGVQANILDRFCTVCHSGENAPLGLSWGVDQYEGIVTGGRMSREVPAMAIVQPGKPDSSYMYRKITGHPGIVGARMPATGVPLDQALIDVVARWILDGAPRGEPADATGAAAVADSFPAGSWMHVWTESLRICTMCHSRTPANPRCGVEFECPPKGVVLTADNYDGVVDRSTVRPFRPENSKLWERVTEDDPDKRMPFGLAPLTRRQLVLIRDWIRAGAPRCPTGEVCP